VLGELTTALLPAETEGNISCRCVSPIAFVIIAVATSQHKVVYITPCNAWLYLKRQNTSTSPAQAVYTVLREAELRSTAPIPYWNVPLLAALDPRQRRVAAALTVINDTLDGLIDRCKQLVRGTAWGQF